MANVTLVLGEPTQNSAGAWVQWDVRDMPVNLGDVTALSPDPANEPRYLTRLRIFRGNNARVQLQFVDVPGGGTSGFASREDMSDAFLAYLNALTLQYGTASDLIIPGPDHLGNSARDTSEPYQFERLASSGPRITWFDAYETAGRPSVTLILDDGQGGTNHAVDAGNVNVAVAVSQPTVTRTGATTDHAVDAGDVSVVVNVAQPTVTRTAATTNHQVDAGDVNVVVAISQPTVTHTTTGPTNHAVDAGNVSIAVAIAQPTVTRTGAMGIPAAPTMLRVVRAGHTDMLIAWQAAVDNGSPVTRYEYRVGSGAWVNTGTAATEVLIGGLAHSTAYSITVRAVNAVGTGPASAALTATTTEATPPLVPQFVTGTPGPGTSVDLAWRAPLFNGGDPITRYEICVIDEDGVAQPFERTDGPALTWRVRGLAFNHRYGFRVRAVNGAGTGPQSPLVHATPVRAPVTVVARGQRIPLLDLDRQSLIVRLAGVDCRIRVWWQPRDLAWYGSIEVPTNSLVIDGRRLATGAGLLDRLTDVLPGNVVCRAIDEDSGLTDPARDAWARSTHSLFWEAD